MISFISSGSEQVLTVERSVLLESKLVAKDSLLAVLALEESKDDSKEPIKINDSADYLEAAIKCYSKHWIEVFREFYSMKVNRGKNQILYNKLVKYYGIIMITKPIGDPMPIFRRMRGYDGYESPHIITRLTGGYVYGINVLCEFIGVEPFDKIYNLAIQDIIDENIHQVEKLLPNIIGKKMDYKYDAGFEDGELRIKECGLYAYDEYAYTFDKKNLTLTDSRGYVYHIKGYSRRLHRLDTAKLDSCVIYGQERYQCVYLDQIISKRCSIEEFYNNPDDWRLVKLGYLPDITI